MIGPTSVLLLAAAGLLEAECPAPGLLQGGDDLLYPDGFEVFACSSISGLSCDGADSDRCREGAIACSGETPFCSDNTGSTIDLCNLLDDDCDPDSADGTEDPSVGLACDGADGDLCAEGTLFCASPALQCSDVSGTNVELCNGLDDDCDLAIDEDFVRDDNPDCATATTFLGAIAGDAGAPQVSQSGSSEKWYRVRLSEQNSGAFGVDLLGRVALVPGPGTDFDLFVYCLSCGGALIGSSTNGGQSLDVVSIRNPDDTPIGGFDDTFDIVIEVRHFSSNRCASWSLTVQGNVADPGAGICDP